MYAILDTDVSVNFNGVVRRKNSYFDRNKGACYNLFDFQRIHRDNLKI